MWGNVRISSVMCNIYSFLGFKIIVGYHISSNCPGMFSDSGNLA